MQQAYRLRPLVLKVFAEQYDKHAECMPHGIVAVVDIVSRFLCGKSLYFESEQLHLAEFAALEMKNIMQLSIWTSWFGGNLFVRKNKATSRTMWIQMMSCKRHVKLQLDCLTP